MGADRMRDAEAREQDSMTGARCWNNSAVGVLGESADLASQGRSGTRGDASSDSRHAEFVTRTTSISTI